MRFQTREQATNFLASVDCDQATFKAILDYIPFKKRREEFHDDNVLAVANYWDIYNGTTTYAAEVEQVVPYVSPEVVIKEEPEVAEIMNTEEPESYTGLKAAKDVMSLEVADVIGQEHTEPDEEPEVEEPEVVMSGAEPVAEDDNNDIVIYDPLCLIADESDYLEIRGRVESEYIDMLNCYVDKTATMSEDELCELTEWYYNEDMRQSLVVKEFLTAVIGAHVTSRGGNVSAVRTDSIGKRDNILIDMLRESARCVKFCAEDETEKEDWSNSSEEEGTPIKVYVSQYKIPEGSVTEGALIIDEVYCVSDAINMIKQISDLGEVVVLSLKRSSALILKGACMALDVKYTESF